MKQRGTLKHSLAIKKKLKLKITKREEDKKAAVISGETTSVNTLTGD